MVHLSAHAAQRINVGAVREPPKNVPPLRRKPPLHQPSLRHGCQAGDETRISHRRFAYQDRVGPGVAQAPRVFWALDATLGDEGGAGEFRREALEGAEVYGEVSEIPVVDADDPGARFEGQVRLLFVVDLHERRQADLYGQGDVAGERRRFEERRYQEDGVGPGPRFEDLRLVDGEILAQDRQQL